VSFPGAPEAGLSPYSRQSCEWFHLVIIEDFGPPWILRRIAIFRFRLLTLQDWNRGSCLLSWTPVHVNVLLLTTLDDENEPVGTSATKGSVVPTHHPCDRTRFGCILSGSRDHYGSRESSEEQTVQGHIQNSPVSSATEPLEALGKRRHARSQHGDCSMQYL
jgi:hypothetical protein